MEKLFFYLTICTMCFCQPAYAAQDACNDVIKGEFKFKAHHVRFFIAFGSSE